MMPHFNPQRKLCLVVLTALLTGSPLATGQAIASTNFFAQSYTGQRNNFSGQVGFAFVPAAPLSVTALGRSVSGGALQSSHLVTIWDTAAKEALAQASVSPASSVDGYGFAFTQLASPLVLQQGRSYCLTSSELAGGDPWMDISEIRGHLAVADVGPGVYSTGNSYPASNYGTDQQGYGLPTLYFNANGIATDLLQVGRPPPIPLLRDVQTGCLLNCTFRAITPYSWTQTPILSGWETDPSGGGWQEIPSGFFPNDFAFNVVSFQLQEANSQQAVTIQHQIAEQTAGKITWEFRFMLPAAMDGAAWQLRDLSNSAVSIITQNGQLCYETAGQPVTLLPVVYGHEYGIKVVANVSARTADIYVDGQLMAQATSFVNPVSSLDYVLVKTGVAATGSMYLPLVRVYLGYAVFETFATCATNRLPDDWQTAPPSGSAIVESFPCAAQPDAFSLNLTNGARVTKSFESGAGTNVVWEFKFLLPQKTDGATAELLAGTRPIFNIVTAGENLSCSNANGQLVPLVTNYLSNLWYDVKAVVNSQAGTAQIFVNGKLAQAAVSFKPAGTNFNGVGFLAGAGTMWVDDVRVYSWQDYPTNYVPQPQPVALRGNYLLGVQSCSLWEEGDAYAGWGYIEPYAQRRTPYLGWYDDGNPEAADWEIKWQVEHGIGFELYCWYRPNDAIDYPIKDGVLEQGLRDGFFNARYSQLKKFAIMFTDQGAGQTNPNDWTNNIIPYWIEYFFKDPRYLKIDGKPVVSIYSYADFENDMGGLTGGKQATDALRAACARAGFPGVIILMEERNGSVGVMQQMQAMGVDYCYAYTWGTGDVPTQEQDNLNQLNAAESIGFQNIPSVSIGWENAPWTGNVETYGWATVPAYQSLAQWAKNTFMPMMPTNSLGSSMILLPNWSEFGEGAFLQPSTLAGFGYLDALREVFTSGGTGPSLIPTAAQKLRFTVLYPKTPAQTVPVTAGLQLWLRADASVTTNGSGVVTKWADQSGLGNDAIATNPTHAPTLQLNSLNGLPTLRFNGSTEYLDVADSASISGLTTNVTIITVVSCDNLTGGYRSCGVGKTLGNIPAPFDWWCNAGVAAGAAQFYLGNGTQDNVFGGFVAPQAGVGVYNIMGVSWQSGTVYQYLNNNDNGHFVYTNLMADGGGSLRIGSRADLATQLQGNLAEIIIYQPALSDANRLNVVQYLANKYALNFPLLGPPSLTIVPAKATSVQISWPSAYSGFVLESQTTLGNGAWLPVATNPPNNSITLGTTNVTRYFRIRSQ